MKSSDDLSAEALQTLRDIRYLTIIFSDGVPDISIPTTDTETLRWDSKMKKLLYIREGRVQLLEIATQETHLRMRPFLTDLVRKAKDFFSDT